MNILFLTLSNMEDINVRGIYSDLIREMDKKNINTYVVTPREKRSGLSTEKERINNINILKVQTGNITKAGMIEKGISTIKIERQYLNAIKKYFKDVKFDMIMYSTPPITFEKVIKYFKRKQDSKTYLILKDIFPQNAVDINLFKKNNLIWKYFRKKEKRLYEISDMIGCMSQANVDYIFNHNNISKDKLEIFPNSIKPLARQNRNVEGSVIYDKYQIPKDAVLFVYGGNLGKPQGIDFLIEVIERFSEVQNGYLLIVGSGTEYGRINNYMSKNNPDNVKLLEKLPKEIYDQLLNITDIGLIFLDRRFTIPNFPSRLTAYMENSIPVLAATDINTDLKDVLEESNSGYWCESDKVNDFIEKANALTSNKEDRLKKGVNGREYLEENYDVTKTVDIILKHL